METYADELREKTGVPGMAIAVVSADQVVHLEGLRRPGGRARRSASMPTRSSSSRRSRSRWPRRCWPPWSARGCVDWDDRVDRPRPRFPPVRPLRHGRGHAPRPALPPQRPARPRGRPSGRPGLRAGRGPAPAAVPEAGEPLPSQLRLHQLRLHGGRRRRGEAAGQAWEDLAADRLFRPLGHEVVELSLRGLRGRREPCRACTSASAASGSPGTTASPTPSPRPAAPARRLATCPGLAAPAPRRRHV